MTVVTDIARIISGQSVSCPPRRARQSEKLPALSILELEPAILFYNEQELSGWTFIINSVLTNTSFNLEPLLAAHWLKPVHPRLPIGPDVKSRRPYVNIIISVLVKILFSCNKEE